MSNLGNKEIMASNIRRYLDKFGYTPKEFSEKLGFKYTTVLDWVNAKTYPRIDKIELMANYFGVEKSDLVEREGYNPTTEEDLEKILGTALSFDGKPMTPHDREVIREILKGYFKMK